jgi:RHS repeat-associated protein
LLTYISVQGAVDYGTDYETNCSYDTNDIWTCGGIPEDELSGGIQATEYCPDGGEQVYYWGGTNDTSEAIDSRSHVQFNPSIGTTSVDETNYTGGEYGEGETYIGYQQNYLSNTLVYPNGSVATFNFVIPNGIDSYLALITSATDPDGHVMTYYYGTNSGDLVLSQVVDFDGKTNKLIYGNGSFPSLITQITNLNYGLAVNLKYDANGFLTNIVDVQGISSSFQYTLTDGSYYTNSVDGEPFPSSTNSVWLLTDLTTPYGNTTFDYFEPTWPLFGASANTYMNRAITVTQPDSGKNLFLYMDFVGEYYPYFGLFYGNSWPGTTTGNSDFNANQNIFVSDIDTEEVDHAYSFYWGPRQYAALSSTTITNLQFDDLLAARARNWLRDDPDDTLTVCPTLNFETEFNPNPSHPGDAISKTTWYGYEGKFEHTGFFESTNDNLPTSMGYFVQEPNSQYYENYTRNPLGYVTEKVDFGSDLSANPIVRTNYYVYAGNNIDLLTNIGPDGVAQQTYTYNGNHEVTSMTDALGETTAYTYNSNGQVTGITRPNGLVTTNIYGTDGFLATTIDYDGSTYYRTNTYTYANGLVATHTDERGLTTTNSWDNLQRLTKVAYPDGTSISYTYNNLDLVKVVDRMGFTNSFAYDCMRRLTNKTDALGHSTVYTYCSCGALESVQDALGNITSYSYDPAGRLINTVYPDGFSTTNAYDEANDVVAVTDSSGKSSDRFFDGLRRLDQVDVYDPLGDSAVAAAYSYDLYNSLTNKVDANDVSLNMTYDALHRLASRKYPDGGLEKYGYTANIPAMTSYTNQLGNFWTYGYDPLNRKTNETSFNYYGTGSAPFNTNRFGYSGAGDLLALTDGNGHTTSWGYDQYGRVTSKTDAASNLIFTYGYDADNRLTNRWTPVTSNTVYAYDSVGNLTKVGYQNATTNTYSYDAMNRLTSMMDTVGTTAYSYDAAGQLLSEEGPWADDTVSYTYANRLRTGLSLPAPNASPWTQSYGYDELDRLTNITSPAGTFAYNFGDVPGTSVDPGSLIFNLSLPNGAYITNHYDGNARLLGTYLRNSSGTNLDTEDYVYDPGNERTQQVFTAGNFMGYVYDNLGELARANGYEAGGTTNRWQEQFTYYYDAAGNLMQQYKNDMRENFHVNSLNELTNVKTLGTLTVAGTTTSPATNVTVNGLTAELYADNTFSATNLTIVSDPTNFTAIAQDSYGRQATNTVTMDPFGSGFAYDLNGNLIAATNGLGTNRIFVYDDENQLVAAWETNTWMSTFTYDGKMRRRIRKEYSWTGSSWVQTNEVHYVYDGNLVIQERDANNLPQVTYTLGTDMSGSMQGAGGIGGLLARTANPLTLSAPTMTFATAFYHADGNGNIMAMIYTNQTIAAKYEYDPFGNILSQIGTLASANLYRFSSKEYHSPSGLIYYLYRYYDPNLQRWVNRDPIEELGGYNLYCFVGDDPIDRDDLLGLEGGSNSNNGPYFSNPYNNPIKIAKDAASCAKQACKDANPALRNAGTAAGSAGSRVISGVVDGAKSGPGLTAIAYIQKMCKACYDCIADPCSPPCDKPCKICDDAKNGMSGPINHL